MPNNIGHARTLQLIAVFLTLLAVRTTSAQNFRFGNDEAAEIELAPPQIEIVSGPTASRLEQARALAANKNWSEAVEIFRKLADVQATRVVALDEHRFVSLSQFCQLQIARLPAEGLAVYRSEVDPLAERLYKMGIANRDEPGLRRVIDEWFCSSWSDDALFALGEIALERADYATARDCWEQLSPLLRDPDGLPPWIALHDIDVEANYPEIERRWLHRPAPALWLACPDTQLNLADISARLILVSLRAGELDRASLEIELFRHMHPDAAGRLGGQQGPYLNPLERLLSSAREWPAVRRSEHWPTFAGSQSRHAVASAIQPITGIMWERPVVSSAEVKDSKPPTDLRESDQQLSVCPVVVDNLVLYDDGQRIHAIDLQTAQPAVTSTGVLFEQEPPERSANLARTAPDQAIAPANSFQRRTLTIVENIAYALTGYNERLIGIDLSREGLLAFQAKADDPSWTFDGSPVSDGHRLWVAMRRSDVLHQSHIACFDTATGELIWRTPIGAADSAAQGDGNQRSQNLLTLVGTRVYCNTNLGIVAAVDAINGDIDWLFRYDRAPGVVPQRYQRPPYLDRNPAPCMYHEGLLIVAPSDSPTVFALDSQTGLQIWSNDELPDVLHVLGVMQQNLIVTGNRAHILDVRTGAQRFVWPESEHAGIRGSGRGLIAGQEIFWPTRDTIYCINALTGERTRPPLSISSLGNNGANLASANGCLIIATHTHLAAFGPTQRTGRFSDQSEITND